MRIFNSIDTAAAKHHLVLCQSSRLIREQILDLTQVLGDVEGPALDPAVQLLIVQGEVIVNEIDLAQFHNLNGHVERDGNQHLSDRNGLYDKQTVEHVAGIIKLLCSTAFETTTHKKK